MSDISRAWLQIHFCVFLWGFTAILGRLISLPAFAIVWWLFIPGLAACAFMIAANRKLAGETAMRAARRSTEAFLYLHTAGVLWLVQN